MLGIRIGRSSWDKWAPMVYMFIIGLALGFVVGFAFGMNSSGGSSSLYLLLIPPVIIVIAFIMFAAMARRIGKDA